MAIYHFSAKVISRANGSSAVAAAAYRSASELHDERLGRDHDFSNKAGVIHSEVLLPAGAPERLADRTMLWNEVERGEKRRDAQLAREIEFAIPRELNKKQGVALAREFVASQFVARGMVADLNVHWDKAEDGSPKPHAHVMLAMREVGPGGFGKKARGWNSTELLQGWREAWASHANQKLAELGLDARIDHRSYAEQGIALEPQHKIGPAASRRPEQGLEAERIEDHARIARVNGERIIADPNVALAAITRQQATFTVRDLAALAFRHSDGKEQFDQVMAAVRGAPELVALGRDGRGQERFTSAEMIQVEGRLERAAGALAAGDRHGVDDRHQAAALGAASARGLTLSGEQRDAFEHVTRGGGLASVVGYAGSGKSAMLGVAREAWEAAGYRVRGAALSGIAAENLEGGAGIQSRTLASLEHGWGQGRDLLTPRDVLVVDEAGMIGTRQMERVLSAASDAGAKVVLVGDPEQLQAIEAGAAFRAIAEHHGAVEITEIRRQREDWQREATRMLATGRTGEVLAAYGEAGMVRAAGTREQARAELVDGWERARGSEPGKSRIILAHTNAEVRELNEEARGRLRAAGELGADVAVATERGARSFAAGDRLMFLRNERELGVKNGSLGRVVAIEAGGERLTVELDGAGGPSGPGGGSGGKGGQGRHVTFYTADYGHVDHGYAATVHKAQGVTVDQAHVLATPGMDRHGAYVALSRHRDGVELHYGRDDFADGEALTRTLSRERAKDMAGDYAGGRGNADERQEPGRTAADELARRFADRREIRLPERVAELVRAAGDKVRRTAEDVGERVQAKARGMFAGFRPKPVSMPERDTPSPSLTPDPAPPEASHGRDGARAVQAFARAHGDVRRMQEKGLPVLPHQRQALEGAALALGKIDRHAPGDLAAALDRSPELARDVAAGRMGGVAKAMAAERQGRELAERAAADQAKERPERERERRIEQERDRSRDRDRGWSR